MTNTYDARADQGSGTIMDEHAIQLACLPNLLFVAGADFDGMGCHISARGSMGTPGAHFG